MTDNVQTAAATYKREASSMLTELTTLVIADEDSYVRAGERAKLIATRINQITELMSPVCQTTDRAHKEAVKLRDDLLTPWQGFKRINAARMADYEQAQERARQEA